MNKPTLIILALTALGAVLEGSLGLLAELGLGPKAVTAVRLAGFVIATILPIIKTYTNGIKKQ